MRIRINDVDSSKVLFNCTAQANPFLIVTKMPCECDAEQQQMEQVASNLSRLRMRLKDAMAVQDMQPESTVNTIVTSDVRIS